MIKEKQRDKKKSVSPNEGCLDGNGTSSGSSESRDDELCEKNSDIKEEPEEQMTEIRENLSTHASPLDEVKSSPTQTSDKDVGAPTLQNSCKSFKTEGGENSDSSFRNDSCDNVLPINIPNDGLHEGVQALPSNVINKQPVSMEAQYMQQQSQIFVFSTCLANKAAEAVMQGQFATIIAYHCSQPRTKKYLEGGGPPTSMSNVPPSCGSNIGVDQGIGKAQHNAHPGMVPNHPSSLNMIPNLSEFNSEMGMSGHQPLTGVKIPDENLTPQQRQHREEQLATLRKMQQMLFPEALGGQENGSNANTSAQPPHPPHMDDVILPENVDVNKPPTSQSDWQKIHIQFYEDPKHKKNRASGPPPSYQQATRSASVPIAMPSPNPSSPNNATSNLSLPSPRTCSGINSPADKVGTRIPGPSPTVDSPNPARSTSSNPPTPVSIHLSPKHKDKISTANEFSPSSSVSAPNSQQSPDSLYCRTVPSGLSQSKQTPNSAGKEPNLMPVPSPQQIQYLNAFEGQELTIQKQPNTSLKETGEKTPALQSTTSLEILPNDNNQCNTSGGNSSSVNANNANNNSMTAVNSTPVGSDIQAKISGPPTPSTPDIANRGNFANDIRTPDSTEKQTNQNQRKLDAPFCNSPQSNDRCAMTLPNNYLQKGPPYLEPSKCSINEKDITNSNYPCMGPANVPLNPNGLNVSAPNKSSHFDPISSLAQMSQQLTNNVPNSPVNQPPMMSNLHQNIVPYSTNPNSNPHLMPLNEVNHIPNSPDHRLQNPMQQNFNSAPRMAPCSNNVNPNMSVSPKLMQNYGVPRPVPRGMNYNGTNVQVKPSAPNTIQYLPSRPQSTSGARGPPSLDFLQRFSNPLTNLDAKVPTHNLQYFPNSYPQNTMSEMGMCAPHGNIRPVRNTNPGIMRLQSPQMSPMGFHNADMYSSQNNCQMFGPSSKPTSLGMAPDASQPLPPSMGQSNNFKNSSFIGPTTADPNYAQQFHNFQQQLYATNTRGQLNSQSITSSQHYFMPK